MKISKVEKEKVRRKIIESTAQMIAKKGLSETTMRDIAKGAGVADATIYKYFATKEKILYAYFNLRTEELIQTLQDVPDFNQYSFQEQFHTLLESAFDGFEKDRAFIKIAYENVFLSHWMTAMKESQANKKLYLDIFKDLVEAAVDAGEFEAPPFQDLFYELLWDYVLGMTYYWLRDTSEKSTNTTQLIDKSLSLIVGSLKSGVLNRAVDVIHFLFREHLLSKIKGPERADRTERNFDLPKTKKRFMANSQV